MIPAFGTRGYVAPELFLPTGEEPDRKRSDLYSLGVVVYELFAGHLPKLDAKREGLDVSEMPGPRVWRLLVRWCGLVDPKQRPESIDVLTSLLRDRAAAPKEVRDAVPHQTFAAKLWNSTNSLVVLGAIFLSCMSAMGTNNALYMTFPVAGVAYLLFENLRGHWRNAIKDGLDATGAKRHVAGIVLWSLVKIFGLLVLTFVLGSAFVYVFEPAFEAVMIFITRGELLRSLSAPPWLENALIVVLSLAALGGFVFLQKRSEQAE